MSHAVIRCYSVIHFFVQGVLRTFFDPNHGVIRKVKGVPQFVRVRTLSFPHNVGASFVVQQMLTRSELLCLSS